MTDSKKRNYEEATLRFFSDVHLLKVLCSEEATFQLSEVRKVSGTGKNRLPLMKGYQLVIATCLHELINTVIICPRLLNLEDDERLRQWWIFNPSREGLISLTPFANPDSNQAQAIASIFDVMWEFRVARTWPATADAISNASHFSNVMWPIATQCIPIPLGLTQSTLSVCEILRVGAIERISDYFADYRLGRTYEFLLNNQREETSDNSYTMNEEPLSGLETHVDPQPTLFPHKQRIDWRRGTRAAKTIAMSQLTPKNKQRNRFNKTFEKLLGFPGDVKEPPYSHLAGKWPSQNFGLAAPTDLAGSLLIRRRAQQKEMSARERMEALLGKERCIIEGSHPTDVMDFPYLLATAASQLESGERIEILRIEHQVEETDSLTWYSFAMRKPAFTQLSNLSRWRIFFKAYAVGLSRDSEHSNAEMLIEKSIREFDSVLNLINLKDITSSEFLDVIEPPAWRYVLQQAKRAESTIAEQRGMIPELLASALLEYWNCERVRTSLEVHSIGKEELDAVGIEQSAETTTCVVLETKGKATTKQEMLSQIRKFKSKIEKLNGALPHFSEELCLEKSINTVRGIFVSMARLDGFDNDPEIEIWDIEKFTEELKQAGIPPRLRNLLSTPTIPFTVSNDDVSWTNYLHN